MKSYDVTITLPDGQKLRTTVETELLPDDLIAWLRAETRYSLPFGFAVLP